jgi:hypothetical protein
MFFSVALEPDQRFPNNYELDGIWVNCDPGWQRVNNTFYKGYADNRCQITVDAGRARVEHSTPRSFPLWSAPGRITNLAVESTAHWIDDVVSMDQSGVITVNKAQLDLVVPNNTITIKQAQQQIRQLLDAKLTQVPADIKLFCSGGLDTLLLYGMLAGRHNFELVTDDHYEPDAFTEQNRDALNQFWAYKQIHHWTQPTWLATGSHGDEYFLRGPVAIATLTAWHDINFGQLLADNPGCYHYHYFSKYNDLWTDAWLTRHRLQKQYATVQELNNQVLNILANDYQHWHLGNTLTWTPYKDIEIIKILLQCPIDELIPQLLDGRLSKDLIMDYNPAIIDYLSEYKNHNARENLPKLHEYHSKLLG